VLIIRETSRLNWRKDQFGETPTSTSLTPSLLKNTTNGLVAETVRLMVNPESTSVIGVRIPETLSVATTVLVEMVVLNESASSTVSKELAT